MEAPCELENDLARPFPEAVAVGPFARERLAAMRQAAGEPLTTRWEPELRE